MKFVAISDTHGQHKSLPLPEADVIIHAGDISSRGREQEVVDFLSWFKDLHFKYKIFIAGNHDFLFEQNPERIREILPPEIIYLNDNEVNIEGVKIWGSPITPWFHDWAFNRRRGEQISQHWNLIPEAVDIVLTHGPVYGILDKTIYGEYVGCEDLLKTINAVKPKFHVCGHIHESYGKIPFGGTTFINASVLNHRYQRVNQPITFEL